MLENWGGPENVPALINGFKARRDPSPAEALVDYLMNSKDRSKAFDAFKAIDPEAEDAVLRGLGYPDVLTRMDTCRILQVIGTGASVTPLGRMVSRGDGFGLDVRTAGDGLRRIQARNGR